MTEEFSPEDRAMIFDEIYPLWEQTVGEVACFGAWTDAPIMASAALGKSFNGSTDPMAVTISEMISDFAVTATSIVMGRMNRRSEGGLEGFTFKTLLAETKAACAKKYHVAPERSADPADGKPIRVIEKNY